ncbi:hypothetical protein MC862_001642 [Proteus mirabilis]|nr:hypothetical protein [Proteus mirabilis]
MDFLKKKEAIIILFLTAMTYTSAISFEYGYAYVFEYPIELIYVDSNSLFKSLIYILVYITLIVITFFTPYPKNNGIIKDIILVIVTTSFMLGLAIPISNDSKLPDIVSIISIAGLVSLIMRIVFSKRNENKSYLIWSFLLPPISLISLSFFIGMYQATVETEFFEFEIENKKYAVIRIYNNKLIAKKIDMETLNLNKETVFFSLDELKGTEFLKFRKNN